MTVMFNERAGAPKTASLTLIEDPRLELVPAESIGAPLTPAQREFRTRWLGIIPKDHSPRKFHAGSMASLTRRMSSMPLSRTARAAATV